MDKENVMYVHCGVLFSHKEEQNHVFCRKMDGNGDHKQSKQGSERQTSHVFAHIWNLEKNHENRKETIREKRVGEKAGRTSGGW
jgi:hypothetical protein